MTNERFQVVFRGQLAEGETRDAVRQRLAAQFRMPEQQLDALFSGKPVVIKRGLDRATAQKLEQAFRKAGAVCEIRGPAETGPAPRSAQSPPPPDNAAADEPPPRPAPARGQDPGATATGPSTGQSGGQSAEELTDDPNQTIVHLAIPEDLGGLGIDPSDRFAQPADDTPAPDIDTSELDLAEPGSRLIETDRGGEPPRIDTGGLDLEPPAGDPSARR